MQTYRRHLSPVRPEIGRRAPAFVVRDCRLENVRCQDHGSLDTHLLKTRITRGGSRHGVRKDKTLRDEGPGVPWRFDRGSSKCHAMRPPTIEAPRIFFRAAFRSGLCSKPHSAGIPPVRVTRAQMSAKCPVAKPANLERRARRGVQNVDCISANHLWACGGESSAVETAARVKKMLLECRLILGGGKPARSARRLVSTIVAEWICKRDFG